MNGDMRENGVKKDFDYMADERLWKKIPPYEYQQPGIEFALGNQALSVASLLAWTALAAGLLVWHGKSLTP
jgi:hypothetical protein